MEAMSKAITAIFLGAWGGVAVLLLLGAVVVFLYRRHRRASGQAPALPHGVASAEALPDHAITTMDGQGHSRKTG